MERKKINDVLKRVEVNATLPPLVSSVLVRISPDVAPSGDRVATLDDKQVEDIDENLELFATIGTKLNP